MPLALTGEDPFRFRWTEPWGAEEQRAPSDVALPGWAHHGIVVTGAGDVITQHRDRPEVITLSAAGEFVASWSADFVQAHGFSIFSEQGDEVLWIADNGSKRSATDGTYPRYRPYEPARGAAIKYSLDGSELTRLTTPEIPEYKDRDYCPTHVAVAQNGDVWVADGYGQSMVHRFSALGEYRGSIDGLTGAGHFDCPHALFIDERGGDPELLVADRASRRIQVFDLDGGFVREFGSDYLTSPGSFAAWGDFTIVAELEGRLTIVDRDGRLVGYLGASSDEERDRIGWPNAAGGETWVAPSLTPGFFNAPHSLAVDTDLNLYVTEFVIGARVVKLESVS